MTPTDFNRNPASENHGIIQEITARAKALGFVAVGFVRPARPPYMDQFRRWIAAGKHGHMKWLERHVALREDPGSLLKGCRTVVSLAYPYADEKPCGPDGFTVARFVEPGRSDYHARLKVLGGRLLETIRNKRQGSKGRVCVDSAPLLERSIAYMAGIGFVGKNNMLIVPGHGSYVFLVEILTTADLGLSVQGPVERRCGACTRCLDACPTGALEAPNVLDASKCLSYLTIEYPGDVSPDTGRKMDPCFFGCDVCQEVCPFNKSGLAEQPSLPSADEILAMGEAEFQAGWGKTSLSRPGVQKIKANIMAIRSSRENVG
jgi:epoxyqueuosine reductase